MNTKLYISILFLLSTSSIFSMDEKSSDYKPLLAKFDENHPGYQVWLIMKNDIRRYENQANIAEQTYFNARAQQTLAENRYYQSIGYCFPWFFSKFQRVQSLKANMISAQEETKRARKKFFTSLYA